MLGDNAEYSHGSRYWGLLPDEHPYSALHLLKVISN
jgi:hypothetical protein